MSIDSLCDWWCLVLNWSCPWCLSPGSFSGCEHGMRRLQWDTQKPWWPCWEEAQQLSLGLDLFWGYQSPKYQGYWSGTIRFFGIRLYSCTRQEELWVCFSLEFCSFISLFAALALCTSTGVASPACCFFMGHLLFSKGSVHPFLVICSYM